MSLDARLRPGFAELRHLGQPQGPHPHPEPQVSSLDSEDTMHVQGARGVEHRSWLPPAGFEGPWELCSVTSLVSLCYPTPIPQIEPCVLPLFIQDMFC